MPPISPSETGHWAYLTLNTSRKNFFKKPKVRKFRKSIQHEHTARHQQPGQYMFFQQCNAMSAVNKAIMYISNETTTKISF
ncbi:MAG: hypothetical protein EZS28_010513 [Streblomastix strix]|uniref:Uncharacterized protein n=1 Tax=Streblomastix strix TaxID=222440 RepID=A0A5J4WG27_9EUKA|nr:MAG: hypothetical protein EZS28_010513 [Streblomastix strix]